jgi:hypothetical protein
MKNDELITFLKDKKISEVEIRESWRTKSVDNLILHLDDGSIMELCSYTDSGCSECDFDGSNENTIAVTIYDQNNKIL